MYHYPTENGIPDITYLVGIDQFDVDHETGDPQGLPRRPDRTGVRVRGAKFGPLCRILPKKLLYCLCFYGHETNSGSAYRGSNPWGQPIIFNYFHRFRLWVLSRSVRPLCGLVQTCFAVQPVHSRDVCTWNQMRVGRDLNRVVTHGL